MAILFNFKKLVLNSIFIFLVILSSDTSAQPAQCNQIAKVLKAKANNYSELVDTNQFDLRKTPFSQAGRDNVDSILNLPSAEKCQVTWTLEREKFVHTCNWKNQNKEESSKNLKVLGDIVEKCILESNLKYDRVNPKSDGNLSFITFYFAKATNLKIVLMKFGSSIKSSFEFSNNQLLKTRSLLSVNGQHDPNAEWPRTVTLIDKEKAENQAKEKLAIEEKKKQLLARQKEERVTREKQLDAQIEQKAIQAERRTAENEKQQITQAPIGKKMIERKATENTALLTVAPSKTNNQIDSIVESNPQLQNANLSSSSEIQNQGAPLDSVSNQVVAKLDPSLTRCWYFASYSSAYQEQNSSGLPAFEAVLLSNIKSIDVDWNADLEEQLKQRLSKQAEQAWQKDNPNSSYHYYNSQSYGHVSCGIEGKQYVETIRHTMNTADWKKEFDATLN